MRKKLSATLEDYLGVVLRFQKEKRFARVSDIASAVGVAKSAVTAALQSLASKALINYQPYEPVTLTEEGEKRAEEIVLRHRIITTYGAEAEGWNTDRLIDDLLERTPIGESETLRDEQLPTVS